MTGLLTPNWDNHEVQQHTSWPRTLLATESSPALIYAHSVTPAPIAALLATCKSCNLLCLLYSPRNNLPNKKIILSQLFTQPRKAISYNKSSKFLILENFEKYVSIYNYLFKILMQRY